MREERFGKSVYRRWACIAIFVLLSASLAWVGAQSGPSGKALTTASMPSVFENTCLRCHGGEYKKAGLDLSTRAGLLRGSDNGPVVVPGNAEASLLYQLVRHQKEPFMPFGQEQLPDAVIAEIKTWINRGAPYDRPLKYEAHAKASAATNTAPPGAAGAEFFEKKIRPILSDHCLHCHSHSVAKVGGGLYMDSPEGLLTGGHSGPAMVPGKPEKSLLVKALRYEDRTLQMPPGGQLPLDQISDIETWIKMGAPDPRRREEDAPRPRLDPAQARRFWSFQPPKDHPVPAVKLKTWPQTAIDHFVLAKLEEKGLKPSPPADRRTLIRRATYDLIGLPPTREEIAAFLADHSPGAFAKVVDRLLASPHYGERWGRYWLDLARYADSKGYVFEEERRYPYSYTYRDWVIRAFNEDLPYDQFLIQQIAADRLPLGEDRRSLAAMGFLTLGRRFLNNVPDIIDDRIDVVTRTTLALTVSCARCHDHKFDPIPTKDYYSLYGIFASSVEPKELPLLGVPENKKDYEAFQSERKVLEEAISQFLKTRHAALLADLRSPAPLTKYLLAARDAQRLPADQLSTLAQKRDLNPFMLQRWSDFLKKTAEGHHTIFAPWHAFSALSDAEFAARAPALAQSIAANSDRQKPINRLVARAFAEKPPSSLREVAERYAKLLADADKPEPARDPDGEALRQVLYAPDAPVQVALSDVEHLFNRADRSKVRDLRKKVDQLQATHPGAPPRAMVLEDAPAPVKPHVFLRGNPNNPGDEVPRQFLAILSGDTRRSFTEGSGRLELARAIASRDNPLTARVWVNRVWLQHFGAGLVRTPSDFGLRSESPTHPELLDFLARRFMDDGWSIKKLHRLIMLSSVYQQGSEDNAKNRAVDPENRLLWRMNRRRLDFEAMRDSLLAVSGQLDEHMGGRPVDLLTQPFSKRRTVYGFIDRQNLPSLFRAFDFASPDTHSPQRYSTTVPQQALFMMNSPFIVEQARQLVAGSEIAKESSAERRIQQLYRRVFRRPASPEEAALGLRFIEAGAAHDADPPAVAVAWQYGIGQYDGDSQRVKDFQRLTHYTGEAWQGGPQRPDPKTGWAMLTAGGGHPGQDAQHAVIRRWTAPREGTVSLSGTLSHKEKTGDGVHARIVSSRLGELASWTVCRMEAETKIEGLEVKAGDTIDFLVDGRRDPISDTFRWSPVVRMTPPAAGAKDKDSVLEWHAANDFNGYNGEGPRPLTTWEKYAQVLLQTNEFIFVD